LVAFPPGSAVSLSVGKFGGEDGPLPVTRPAPGEDRRLPAAGPAGRVFIRTFGCRMNQHDSEKLLLALAPAFLPAPAPEEADLVLLNTCSIREKAEQKVYSYLGRLAPLKRARPSLLIGVGGCLARQEGKRLLARSPLVDFVFGPDNLDEVPALVEARRGGGRRMCSLPQGPGEWRETRVDRALPSSAPPAAAVTIAKGCDNFCSYCVVPLVRGREVSRPGSAIVAEVEALVERGASEVTLLGQNVNSWSDPENPRRGFVHLLEKVDGVRGLRRLRFATSHPRDLSLPLVEAMAALPTVCEHLHLPLQSGSDRVLAAMNRGYTAAEYREKAGWLREKIPGIELTTDVIVGFPGESREDFERTLELVREIRFQNSFSFRYSPRPGTAAAALSRPLPPCESALRHGWLPELQAVQDAITAARHLELAGSVLEVLVEGESPTTLLEGRTRDNFIVHFPGDPALVGRMVKVMATRACKVWLEGEVVP